MMMSLVVALLALLLLFVQGDKKLEARSRFRKLDIGESLVGASDGQIKTVSVVACSEKCLFDLDCKGYRFNKNQELNCFLIKNNSTGGSRQTLVSDMGNVVYKKDHCYLISCQHGGQCVDGINSYTCACPTGWTGNQCQEVDDCVSNTCQNNGTCMDGINSYTCTCAAGFNGYNCGTNIDDCPATNPCQNGGACVDAINSFTCECALNYGGSTCRINCTNPWCTIIPWTLGDTPGKYFDFESTTGMTMHSGAALSSGKVARGISLDQNQKQWVDLGVLTNYSCFPLPETCGPDGATLTAWVNLIHCCGYCGFISSSTPYTTGFSSSCRTNTVKYFLIVPSGKYEVKVNKQVGWFHLTVVYRQTGGRLSVYYDGELMGTDTSLNSIAKTSSSGTLVLGRKHTNRDADYATVKIDELTLWDN